MQRTVITPPAEEPVALEATKSFLRIGHASEDALVTDLMAAARSKIELALDIALVTRTVELVFDDNPVLDRDCRLTLRPSPVVRLISVETETDDGIRTNVTSRFTLAGTSIDLWAGETWPILQPGDRLVVRFDAGFGAAGDVPEALAQAVKLMTRISYLARDGVPVDAFRALSSEIAELIAPYREVRV